MWLRLRLRLREEEARAEGLDARGALELGQLDDQCRAPQHLLVITSRREERVEGGGHGRSATVSWLREYLRAGVHVLEGHVSC